MSSTGVEYTKAFKCPHNQKSKGSDPGIELAKLLDLPDQSIVHLIPGLSIVGR